MTDFLPISEIDSRRARIGLDAQQLYSAAGVAQSSWNRALRGENTTLDTLERLTGALHDAELSLLRHLLPLHSAAVGNLLAEDKRKAAA